MSNLDTMTENMKDSRIAEKGTHEELVKKDGEYAKMLCI